MTANLRIGQGFDVHAFADGRALVLGGVEISQTKGLIGHSDADVLLHAIIDAILGALCWGDIGKWFPDTEAEYKDADSGSLLAKVWKKVKDEGWELANLDATILAQAPKLAPHIEAMCENIARLLGAGKEQISVKATTTERLGFVGRKEGMAATAVVLLVRSG